MTSEQCNKCRYAPPFGTYSTCSGDDLPVWTCDMMDDPRMPFDMEDDTDCPCYKEYKEEYDNVKALMGHDYYLIETHDDGRYIHLEEFIWDATEADRMVCDDDDNEIPADVVVTEFTGCYIPLDEFLKCKDRRELVCDREADVQQYEGEYTFEQFVKLFPPSELSPMIDAGTCYTAEYLPWDDIKEDTPDGWYYA